jgi:hypothetical protein
MIVNGLQLPTTFVQAVRQGRTDIWWMLKEGVDAYGSHFDMDALELFGDAETIKRKTAQLAQDFLPENDADDLFADWPGFIPWILDFSRVVCFGHMHEQDPVCFDFRDDPQEPSIIFWDEPYWRRLAPDFEAFMALFEPFDIDKWLGRV